MVHYHITVAASLHSPSPVRVRALTMTLGTRLSLLLLLLPLATQAARRPGRMKCKDDAIDIVLVKGQRHMFKVWSRNLTVWCFVTVNVSQKANDKQITNLIQNSLHYYLNGHHYIIIHISFNSCF